MKHIKLFEQFIIEGQDDSFQTEIIDFLNSLDLKGIDSIKPIRNYGAGDNIGIGIKFKDELTYKTLQAKSRLIKRKLISDLPEFTRKYSDFWVNGSGARNLRWEGFGDIIIKI